MAQISFKRGTDYALRLSALGNSSEGIAKMAVFEGAGILTDAIRVKLLGVISEKATGDLYDSIGITPITKDKDGFINAKIGFDGYDRKGQPNNMKARILESGSSRTNSKHPFVEPAVREKRAAIQKKMAAVVEEEIKKRMK